MDTTEQFGSAPDATIPQGKRNSTLVSIVQAMNRKGCETGKIHSTLIEINRTRCAPPLEFAELKQIADSFSRHLVVTDSGFDGMVLLDDENPQTIAAAFEVASEKKHTYNCIDGWSLLDGEKYRKLGEAAAIEVDLRRFLNLCRVRKSSYDGQKITKPVRSTAKIRNIMTELVALEGVYIPKEKAAPASLDGKLDPENIIALNNCLLDVSATPPKVIELTKEFYTFACLPFDYDASAECPQWEKFLADIFTPSAPSAPPDATGDELAISTLQEWFGYLITNGTYLQKIFVLTGPARSGKSTIGKLLRALVGNANTVSPSLTSLARECALQPLINKTVAIIGDANRSGKTNDITRAIERLKSISGEDPQQINRTSAQYVEVEKLGVRIVMITNYIQDIWNSTDAIANRFNFLITTNSFLGREDMRLEKRLMTELPGIFNWSLKGLKRLRERGYMLEHPAGIEAWKHFEKMSSPMKAFVSDCCVVKCDALVPVDALWRAHCNWSNSNGKGIGFSKQKFTNEIKAVVIGIKKERRRTDVSKLHLDYDMVGTGFDGRVNFYLGIDLKEDCKKKVDSVTSEIAK